MAWPAEAGSLGIIQAPLLAAEDEEIPRPLVLSVLWSPPPVMIIVALLVEEEPEPPPRPFLINPAAWIGHHYHNARGKYRVFNAAEYRFQFDNSAPPADTDPADETDASLPFTTVNNFADGGWYGSVSLSNGVLDSGFRRLGELGSPSQRIEISAGVEVDAPPNPPGSVRLELRSGGVVRIIAHYQQVGTLRADTWSIARTFNGAAPATDNPEETVAIPTTGLALLQHDLTAQANGTTVKVRLQTRRSASYSEDSSVLTATADAVGPTAPISGEAYPGPTPEDL